MASAVMLTGPLLSHKAAAGAVAAEGGLSRPKRALDGRMKRRVTPGAEHALEKEDVSESSFDATTAPNEAADSRDADIGDINARTSRLGSFVDAGLEEMYVRKRWETVHREVGGIMILLGIIWAAVFGTGLQDVNKYRMPLIYAIKAAGLFFYCGIGWAYRKRWIYRLASVRRSADFTFVVFVFGQFFQQISAEVYIFNLGKF